MALATLLAMVLDVIARTEAPATQGIDDSMSGITDPVPIAAIYIDILIVIPSRIKEAMSITTIVESLLEIALSPALQPMQ